MACQKWKVGQIARLALQVCWSSVEVHCTAQLVKDNDAAKGLCASFGNASFANKELVSQPTESGRLGLKCPPNTR